MARVERSRFKRFMRPDPIPGGLTNLDSAESFEMFAIFAWGAIWIFAGLGGVTALAGAKHEAFNVFVPISYSLFALSLTGFYVFWTRVFKCRAVATWIIRGLVVAFSINVIATDTYQVDLTRDLTGEERNDDSIVHGSITKSRWFSTGGRVYIVGRGSSESGRVTESGKRHGKWSFVLSKEEYPHLNVMDRFVDVWYWYGEEVTEGEWHKLNR